MYYENEDSFWDYEDFLASEAQRDLDVEKLIEADPSIDSIDTPLLTCFECGEETNSDEGLCYECQCLYHQHGAFDMDGLGWIS